MKVSIIIPVYNEKEMIHVLVKKVMKADTYKYVKEVIFVDDGSNDGTTEILREYAEKFPIKIILHERNMGKGASIKTGLTECSGDIILIQDADLEYSPDDYRMILKEFDKEGVSVVYGSRFLKKMWPKRMRLQNWIANRLFTFLTNLLYKSKLTDEGTAYKAFKRAAIMFINIKSRGFEFCPEVTAKLLKEGIRIHEVPISYRARNKKEGKKPRFMDSLRILWTIVKYRLIKWD